MFLFLAVIRKKTDDVICIATSEKEKEKKAKQSYTKEEELTIVDFCFFIEEKSRCRYFYLFPI